MQTYDNDIVRIKFIVTSDIHGNFFQYDFIENQLTISSLSQIFTYVKEQRGRKDQEVVLLDNGDLLQGQPSVFYANKMLAENQNYKHICAEIMNLMEYDAATIGNHDIEAGHEVYDRLKTAFNFPWLAANAICKETGEPYFKPYAIIKRRGVKIAVLGLVTPVIPYWIEPEKWSGIEFEDMIVTARKWVQHIKLVEKPDILIGLFHSGIDYTYNRQTADTYKNENASLLVAQRVPGFDVVFAGHDHLEYNLKIENVANQKVLVLSPQAYGKYVSVVEVKLRYDKITQSFQKIDITGYNLQMDFCDADKEFKTRFGDFIKEIKTIVSEPVGQIDRKIRSREALFGNTAFLDLIHRVQLDFTKAQISFAAPLSWDVTINRGTVFIRDIFKLYKFDNLLYVLKLKGFEIKKYLEFSFGIWFNRMRSEEDTLLNFKYNQKGELILAEKFYNFSTAAGIKYLVNLKAPIGHKISILSMSNGSPFEMDKEYLVVLNSYRANGGGGHLLDGVGLTLPEIKERVVWKSQKDVRSIIIDWFRQNKDVQIYALNHWRAIPKNWWFKGRALSLNILFPEDK